MADEIELSPEQKAAIARFKGEETPKETPKEGEGKTAEEIEAEKKEADRIAAEEAEKAKIEKEKNTPAPVVAELTDEQLMELVAKKSGRKVTSWDDLKPTPEVIDKEKLAQQRESEKLSFGLKNLFNKKLYEDFIADKQNPIGLVYTAELNEAKKDDPNWDEDKEKEFKEEFEAKFGLTLDPSSSKYKRGQKQINIIAETILRHEYTPIFQLEGEYSKHESQTNQQKINKEKILTQAPIYKKDVEDSIASLSKIEFPFGEEKYEVPVSKEIRDSIQEVLMDQDFVSSKILEGYKKEEIAQIAHNMIISQNYSTLAYEAAKQYREKHEKGVRGIPEGGRIEKKSDGYETLSDSQKTALNFFQPAGSKAN